MTGTLDDVRIYSRALSQAEIQEIYNSSFNLAPTVAITSPADGTSYPVGQPSITIDATALDTDGTIQQVEFFANGASGSGRGRRTRAPPRRTAPHSPVLPKACITSSP